MRYYETLYIVNPNFEDKKVETIISEVGVELQKTNSKPINHHVWGKKRLAYPIQKQKYGTFILIQYSGGDTGSMVEFDTWMKLNTSILRHLTTRLEVEPPKIEAPVFEKTGDKTKEQEKDKSTPAKEDATESEEKLEDASVDVGKEEAQEATEESPSDDVIEPEDAKDETPEEAEESVETEKESK